MNKERAEIENALGMVKKKMDDIDRRIIRPLRSVLKHNSDFEKYLSIDIISNENEKKEFLKRLGGLKDDFDKFIELDSLVELELRPEKNRLEEELKNLEA